MYYFCIAFLISCPAVGIWSARHDLPSASGTACHLN